MSIFGRFMCKVNGHWKGVDSHGLHMYQSLEETYRLDDGLHLKYCTRCHKVSLYARNDSASSLGWGSMSKTFVYNPLAMDEGDEVWVCLWEMA